jgi:hypothetical protein
VNTSTRLGRVLRPPQFMITPGSTARIFVKYTPHRIHQAINTSQGLKFCWVRAQFALYGQQWRKQRCGRYQAANNYTGFSNILVVFMIMIKDLAGPILRTVFFYTVA